MTLPLAGMGLDDRYAWRDQKTDPTYP